VYLGEQQETDLNKLIQILSIQEKRNLTEVKKQRISENVKVSLIEGLSLKQYLLAKAEKCQREHKNCLTSCSSLVKAGNIVSEKKCVPLSYLWNKCFTSIAYESDKAQRRLLQMPLAALNVKDRIFIVEKDYDDSSSYDLFIKCFLSSSEHSVHKESHTSREEYESFLLHVAQTESAKEILKHTLCSTHNLSRRKASKMYGICRVSKRSVKVNNAIKVAKEIRKKNIALAKEEKKNLLVSSGLQPDDILTSSCESDDTSSDYSDCTELSDDSGEYNDGESATGNTSIMESAQLPMSGLSCGADHNDFLKETGMEHSCQ
jgi:hypothetical protein